MCVCVWILRTVSSDTRNEKNVSQAGARSRREVERGELGTEVDVGEWKVKNLKGHKLINH